MDTWSNLKWLNSQWISVFQCIIAILDQLQVRLSDNCCYPFRTWSATAQPQLFGSVILPMIKPRWRKMALMWWWAHTKHRQTCMKYLPSVGLLFAVCFIFLFYFFDFFLGLAIWWWCPAPQQPGWWLVGSAKEKVSGGSRMLCGCSLCSWTGEVRDTPTKEENTHI